MKKLLLTLTAVTALSFASQAQTEQGKVIVGGGIGFSSNEVKDSGSKTTSFNIQPNVGYFVSDNIAIGAGIGYNWSKNENENLTDATYNSFRVAPFARLYTANSPVRFFGQLSVPMAWGSNKVDDKKTASTANYGVNLSPGIAYFPTENIGIELSVRGLYYSNNNSTSEATDIKTTSNSFGLDANSLSPTLGVQFHF